MDQNLKKRLLSVVEKSGLSQRKFGGLIGKSPNSINKIIQGSIKMDKTIALAIEAVTGVNAEWLLTGEGKVENDPRDSLDLSQKLILDMLNGDESTLAEKVFEWIDSKASKRKYSFGKESWTEEQTNKYNSLIRDAHQRLGWFFGSEDGQFSVLISLQILYFGDIPENEKSMAGQMYEKTHEPRVDEIKKIRKELEELIGLNLNQIY